jgi:purine-binding chemotaxis protein CheW
MLGRIAIRPQQIGIIVDSVSEVSNIKSGEIEDAPHLGQDIDTNFILGLGKTKERIVILLDIALVLSSEELETVEQLAKE